MVLQAFSWHAARPDRSRRYPTFAESRFMAYDSIVHGACGLYYWGSWIIDDPAFRRSLYALTSEIAALEPLLVAPETEPVRVRVVDDLFDPPGRGVRAMLRRQGAHGLLILVNEDPHRHLGVDVTGVDRGGIVTRLQGFEVKVFSTDGRLESPKLGGRDYDDNRSR